jgi:hypothetical protein
VTVATFGVAAWVWSQRKEDDEETDQPTGYQGLDYDNADYGDNPAYGTSKDGADPKTPTFGGAQPRSGDAGLPPGESSSSGWAALRRTPSPQQFFDSAKRTVAAGVTAAGVAVGSALSAIREEDKTAYADHETWSEEVEAKKEKPAGPSQTKEANKRRKKVAIVISADNRLDDVDSDGFHEHAVSTRRLRLRIGACMLTQNQSILSHIPRQLDASKIKLHVLIYAPNLTDTTLDATSNLPPPSLSSSFSNIEHAQAQASEEARSPL